MSFRQIFDRISRIARVNATDLFGTAGRHDEELRRAQELIDGERRREEKERESASRTNDEPGGTKERPDRDGMTLEQASAIIGVPPTASLREITASYRRRIALVHPDRFAGKSTAEHDQAIEMTQKLNIAYAYLKRRHGS
jgi:DnaJ-domain-containing protein 1